MGVHSEIFQIDVASRRARQLTDGEHFIPRRAGRSCPSAGQIVFQFDEPTRFGDVWTLPLAASGAPHARDRPFDALERDFALPRQEKVEWKGADGATIEGLLFYPVDYQPGTPLSAGRAAARRPDGVRQVRLRRRACCCNYLPVLAGKGYAVLRPNYRGSTGYGNASTATSSATTSTTCTSTSWPASTPGRSRHRRSRSAVVDGLERRRHADQQADHVDRSLQGGLVAARASRTGCRCTAQTDARRSARTWFGGTPWQKDAPIDAVLEQLADQGRRERRRRRRYSSSARTTRACRWRSRSRCTARSRANGVPTQLVHRAARGASVERAAPPALQGQHRAGMVRAVRDAAAPTSGKTLPAVARSRRSSATLTVT